MPRGKKGIIKQTHTSGTDAGYFFAKQKIMSQEDVNAYQGKSASFKAGLQKYVDEATYRKNQDNVAYYDPGYQSITNPIVQNILAQQRLRAWNSFNSGDASFDQAKIQAALKDPESQKALSQFQDAQNAVKSIDARNAQAEGAVVSELTAGQQADPHKGQYIVWSPIDPTQAPQAITSPTPTNSQNP